MAKQSYSSLGSAFVLGFCLSQTLRDIYFGHVFQDVDFFAVILVAFLLSTVLFAGIAMLRSPGQFGALRGKFRLLLALNLTTALAWSCYFFALTHLEPAIVNTIHSGMAPLTVVALVAFGAPLAQTAKIGHGEYLSHAGIGLALIGLCWVAVSGASGLQGAETTTIVGLAAVTVSGTSITISLLLCKRLHDSGISAETVTTVRYLALIAIAAMVVFKQGELRGVSGTAELTTLAALATALIVIPLFVLQLGIARTAPLTAHILRALSPVFVFAAQQLDGRLSYSTPTLICILAYSAVAIAGALAHSLPGSAWSLKSLKWQSRTQV